MIIIVLGMHRSGTSTVAGVLHMNKIVMGTYENFWPRPLRQNPKGFYENYDFRKINDQILKNSGYDTKSYNINLPKIRPTTKLNDRTRKILETYSEKYFDWGWKDPRTCLTIDHWVKNINDLGMENQTRIVVVTRKASSVARSLYKRNELPIDNGLAIWGLYTEKVLSFCEKSQLPIHYCSFESLLQYPEKTCKNLFHFLNTDYDPAVISRFIDKEISTSSRGSKIKYPNQIQKIENEIYSKIIEE